MRVKWRRNDLTLLKEILDRTAFSILIAFSRKGMSLLNTRNSSGPRIGDRM